MDGNKRRRLLRKRIVNFATWNVQDMRTKETEVFHVLQRHKIDICVLTQTKKKGIGNEIKNGYIHVCSGIEKIVRPKRSVGIAIFEKFRTNIKSWDEIGEWIITM